MSTVLEGHEPLYSCSVTKFDRHGYQRRPRIMVITSNATFLFDPKDGKLKQKIQHGDLKGKNCLKIGGETDMPNLLKKILTHFIGFGFTTSGKILRVHN